MEPIYQSSILHALGWAIADSIWQMALLWLVFQVCIGIPIKNKPIIRHLGSAIALLGGGLWFLGTVVYNLSKASYSQTNSNGRGDPSFSHWIESTLPYLSAAYLIILIVLLARFAHSVVITQRLRTTENESAGQWQQFVDDMALRFFIERKVRIQISDAINVPATLGYIKPIILLPIASINHLSISQVESIIMHELAHIKRHDYLVNIFVTLVETILFFNPFAHLLSKQVRKECELCCDDAVLNHQKDPGQYAYALLLLERTRQQFALAVAATGSEGQLLGRVKRILKQPEQKSRYRNRLLALVLVAAMIMGLSLLSPAPKEGQSQMLAVASVHTEGPTQFIRSKTALPELLKKEPVQEKKRIIQPLMKQNKDNQEVLPIEKEEPMDEFALPFLNANAEDLKIYEVPVAPAAPPAPRSPKSPHTQRPPAPYQTYEPMAPPQGYPAPVPIEELIQEFPRLIQLEGMNEKELVAIFNEMKDKHLNVNGQLFAQAEQELAAMKNISRMAEARQKLIESQQRKHVELKKEQERIRVITPGRKARPDNINETSSDKVNRETSGSRTYNYTFASSKPKVKTFKDESGLTISIMEDEQQIRIQFSNR
jgi:beta-lactamase regulating signal transducer with metallopeptidase domain